VVRGYQANGVGCWSRSPEWVFFLDSAHIRADGERKVELSASLDEIVPTLLQRFSSKEGYRAFQDAIPIGTSSSDDRIHRHGLTGRG
jgi:hypothetical protein